MGIFGSRPVAPAVRIAPDFSGATLTGANVSQQFATAQTNANAAITGAIQEATAKTSGFYFPIVIILLILFFIALGIVMYDTFAPDSWPNIFFDKKFSSTNNSSSSTGVRGPVGSQPPAPPPTIISSLMSYFMDTSSSGDFLPSGRSAESSSSIEGSKAPLSSQKDGAYSMQWWMFVKDWNYGYGKEKSIVKRPDPTNSSIHNPHISLHPTDNSMRISVSVFPTSEGGSSKTEPAPVGHSGSTDDVFICEVPDIPLQSWFSVSVSVFGRNLDVYINGNLVKSCFLTGVPKPATGDINLTSDGGFSGKICNFYHLSRMITPGDAMNFYNRGTSCRNDSGTENTSSSTGYSVKFGVYDALGKEVQEYAF